MGRKKKLLKIRKPKVRVTKKGLKVSRPSARIGGKLGTNISSKGISTSIRTGKGHVNISGKGVKGRVGSRTGVSFGKGGVRATRQKARKKSGCLPGCGSVLVFALILLDLGTFFALLSF